ncbi:SDR family oxidoreductase [uncultured Aquitalea sp.]|uniref:SDR family NAD(P)-dependent oxidoreductase n=1 Tax=uncultured Aquitalea sp. TaxID=540272 RepID=UPI0025DD4450|nr:SDR family oxidoreductase [uncultured Aquitalea sp.]
MSLRDKTIIVTGAGTGIGAACVERFTEEGARLVLIGRRAAPLQALASRCDGLALAGDAASSADWADFMPHIMARFGGVDGLVACAGGLGEGAAEVVDDVSWHQALQANLGTAFASARACLPALRESGGAMVLLASIAALAAGPEVCAYVTGKHALLGLMRSLAVDYGPQGVRVNAVCPGWVRTPMADAEMAPLMTRHGDSLEAAYRRVTADVPLRRPAEAHEIAAICRFLLSTESSIIHGAAIVADGGSSIVDVPTLAFSHL